MLFNIYKAIVQNLFHNFYILVLLYILIFAVFIEKIAIYLNFDVSYII